jgi:hypothetical protein
VAASAEPAQFDWNSVTQRFCRAGQLQSFS